MDAQMTPMIQLVTREGDRTFAFSEIATDNDDPATISDEEIKQRVARYLDQDVNQYESLIVTRPRTGNILIAPKPVYG